MKQREGEVSRPRGVIRAKAYDPEGNLKWSEEVVNLITDEGKDAYLEFMAGQTAVPGTWYIGLTDSTPTFAAGDVMSSHAGWAENTDYDEVARQAWSPNAVSGQAVNNNGSEASFTISTGGTTVGGVFFVSDNTKGGTSGILLSGSAFGSGDRDLNAGDTLQIEYEQQQT